MAKIPVRDGPKFLPQARLYLDQIEAIQCVFLEYLLPDAEPHFEYDVDKTDRFKSIEELVEHGGHADTFSLRLSWTDKGRTTGGAVFVIGGIVSSPWISIPYRLSEHEWAICGKIEQIVKPRVDQWIQFANSLPNLAIYAPATLLLASSVLLSMKLSRSASACGILAAIATILVALKFYGEMIRKSRVYLRYERTKQKESANRRNELLKNAFLLTLGYALKSLFDYLTALVGKHR